MSVISLLSDFGNKDYSVAAVKGSLYNLIDKPIVVDISHEITPHNLFEAAYNLKATYQNFPKNSIHIIGVDSEYSSSQKHILAKLNDHFFIGADNGIFSMLADESQYEHIIEIEHPKSKTSSFPVLDVFVDIAAQIVFKEALKNLGNPIATINKWASNKPNIADDNELIGHIIYIDRYGNVICDISQKTFNEFCKGRAFEIIVSRVKINKIHDNYSAFINFDLPEKQRQKAGKALAIFNSLDFLEIALYKSDPHRGGSAASLLGLAVGDSIKIKINK